MEMTKSHAHALITWHEQHAEERRRILQTNELLIANLQSSLQEAKKSRERIQDEVDAHDLLIAELKGKFAI